MLVHMEVKIVGTFQHTCRSCQPDFLGFWVAKLQSRRAERRHNNLQCLAATRWTPDPDRCKWGERTHSFFNGLKFLGARKAHENNWFLGPTLY